MMLPAWTSKLATNNMLNILNLLETTIDFNIFQRYLDYYNIMSYDYHGSWENVTGQNSPLYPSSVNSNGLLNQNASIYGWIANGATTSKLLLGIAFYGHSFTLADNANTALGAPTTGPGTAGPYTNQSGILDYLEVYQKNIYKIIGKFIL